MKTKFFKFLCFNATDINIKRYNFALSNIINARGIFYQPLIHVERTLFSLFSTKIFLSRAH